LFIYLRFEFALHIWTFDIYRASPICCQWLPPAQLCFRLLKREYEITETFLPLFWTLLILLLHLTFINY